MIMVFITSLRYRSIKSHLNYFINLIDRALLVILKVAFNHFFPAGFPMGYAAAAPAYSPNMYPAANPTFQTGMYAEIL